MPVIFLIIFGVVFFILVLLVAKGEIIGFMPDVMDALVIIRNRPVHVLGRALFPHDLKGKRIAAAPGRGCNGVDISPATAVLASDIARNRYLLCAYLRSVAFQR